MVNKRDYIIALLFAFALIGAYTIYKPFLLSMVVALLLTMATGNIHLKITHKMNSEKVSASILSLLLLIILFVPITYIATIGVQSLASIDADIITQTTTKLIFLSKDIPLLEDWAKEYLNNEKILEDIKTSTTTITAAGSHGIGFIKNVFFVIVFYFMLNSYADKLFSLITSFLPMNDEEGNQILKEISSTMEVVFYSIIVTAIFEGLLFGIVISFFGFNGLLLGTIYGFASLIPIVGGALVWMPVSLYAWNTINANSAIIIALYSILIISILADTFIKPMIIRYIKDNILHSSTRINELLIFFSILAGMSSYGFWGMILGPAITSFLIAISRVYIELYGQNTR
ncbi:MAG: Acid membrane antigen A [uncultured Sulfurovum sp.]|uniref:Acid membrane antigen A n=1 Tax=uncultured Sulfurovum sp. TaxID=269237 RepID=A0A6S6SPJ5_9BACT|nr:MAG: Acid membrane antigen A [uncultured Sulfurovum sp.]